jgi:8-oxo-dGTP diphosphatase
MPPGPEWPQEWRHRQQPALPSTSLLEPGPIAPEPAVDKVNSELIRQRHQGITLTGYAGRLRGRPYATDNCRIPSFGVGMTEMLNRGREGCSTRNMDEMTERLRTQAVVPILRKQGRVLVIRRGSTVILPGYWCPPSGRIEPGETQEEAVVREVDEELGLVAKPVAKVWECPTDDGDFTLHWWTAEVEDYKLRPDPSEVGEVRWVTADEFLELEPTFVGDREFFSSVLPKLQPEFSK